MTNRVALRDVLQTGETAVDCALLIDTSNMRCQPDHGDCGVRLASRIYTARMRVSKPAFLQVSSLPSLTDITDISRHNQTK